MKRKPLRHQLQLLQLPLRLAGTIEPRSAARADAPSNERIGPTTLAQPPESHEGFVSPQGERHQPSHQMPWSIPAGVRCESLTLSGDDDDRHTTGPLGKGSQGIQRHRLPFPTKGVE